ncbi:hypothetical protein [Novosphingobium taihuense]|uniref:Uncharacterized protein n=1 Tax=Novosphingobium taihuense TaxID=260085 RepID=A0A7W7EVY7_9SPHN|nr:hypothetical protein [Novosphingobium taihuense]MBB4615529.1 hypothetical protein [Novosphingobium taihuense]TWH82821.1 hypothetical protein IQ25_03101 [Novosphingobium taihuense]
MIGTRTIITLAVAAAAMTASQALAKEFAIGGGIKVTLGDDWTGTSMQNPAMGFPGMKDVMEEATESRLRGPGSGVLVSYMKFKTKKAASDIKIDDAANVVKAAQAAYAQAVETDLQPVVRISGETVRAYLTLHAKPGARLNVAGGYPGGCVTTGTIRLGAAIHNVSIASESCESAGHKEALAAIFEIGT